MADYDLGELFRSRADHILDTEPLSAIPGEHTLWVDQPYTTHIQCVGAGGGGGGDSDRQGWGGRGQAGLCTMTVAKLDPGFYRLVIGKGGAGGRSTDDAPPGNGEAGGPTFLEYKNSGLRYASAAGGAGGGTNQSGGQNGANSFDHNGILLASGGKHGGWQESGAGGGFPGAGGGGAGNQGGDNPNLHGGNGGHGRMRIILVSG